MNLKRIRNLALPAIACVAMLLAGASTSVAQPRERVLSDPAYREMQRLARQLDRQAEQAADQARNSRYRVWRRNSALVRLVTDFAGRANQFDDRLNTYRTRPWQVDDELAVLLRSARNVQRQVRASRWVDDRTVSEWNDVVAVLNRMLGVYRDGTRIASGGYPGQVVDPRYTSPPDSDRRYPDRRYENRGGYGYSRESLVSLARDLADRAARARATAERLAGGNRWRQRELLATIQRFDDQAAAFHERVGSGDNDREQIRAEANRLMDDARRADQDMRQANAFPEVWQEWQDTMQVLQRITDLVGA